MFCELNMSHEIYCSKLVENTYKFSLSKLKEYKIQFLTTKNDLLF